MTSSILKRDWRSLSVVATVMLVGVAASVIDASLTSMGSPGLGLTREVSDALGTHRVVSESGAWLLAAPYLALCYACWKWRRSEHF